MRVKAFLRPILWVGLVFLSGEAHATVVAWAGNNSAAWSNTSNWTGGILPGPGDTASFSGSPTFGCTVDVTYASGVNIALQPNFTKVFFINPGINPSFASFSVDGSAPGAVSVGANTMTVSGGFAMGSSTFVASSSSALVLNGAVNITGGTFNPNGGTVVFGGGTFNTLNAGIVAFSNVSIIASSNLTLTNTLSVSGNLTLNNSPGVFDTSGYPVSIVGNYGQAGAASLQSAATGSMTVGGNFTIVGSGIFSLNGGTLTLNGSAARTLNSPSVSLTNLTISGTGSHTLVGNLTVGSNINIAAGGFADGGNTITLAGGTTWNHSGGTFTATGTLNLSGGNQTFLGSSTFFGMSKSSTGTDTLTFGAGTTQTITSGLILQGSLGNNLSLRSSTAGTPYVLASTGVSTLRYLNVKDSTATTALTAPDSVDLGNNLNWNIIASTPTPTWTPSWTPTPSPTPTINGSSCPNSDALNSGALAGYWTPQDINASGGSQFEGGSLTVTANSGDLSGGSDSFRLISQNLNGDVDMWIRVNAAPTNSSSAKAGLMIRESNAPGAVNVAITASNGGTYLFGYRSVTNGGMGTFSGPVYSNAAGGWVRLTRSGSNYTGYYSNDGSTWQQIGSSVTVPMAASYLGGIVVSTFNNSLGTASFNNFTAFGTGCGTVTPTPPPCITVDSTGHQSAFSGSMSYIQNVATSNEVMILAVQIASVGAPNSTIAGYTLLRHDNDSPGGQTNEIWYRLNPPPGSNSIVVNNSLGSVGGMVAISTAYNGAVLAPPSSGTFASFANATATSASLSTLANYSQLIGVVASAPGAIPTPVSGQVVRGSFAGNKNLSMDDREVGLAGLQSDSYSFPFSSLSSICLVELQPLCSQATPTPTMTATATPCTNPPSASFTAPAPGAVAMPGPSVIAGSAFAVCGVVNQVQLQIQDQSTSLYYNGTSFISAAPLLLNAVGTGSWSYTTGLVWTAGHVYLMNAKATDSVGNVQSVLTSLTIQLSTPTPSITMTSTLTETPSITQTGTPSMTPSVTPSTTPSITQTGTPSMTPSVTPSITQSITQTVTPSMTPSMTPSTTQSVSPSITPSITQSVTPSATPSITPSVTPSTTASITSLNTSTSTQTPSVTSSITQTATPTVTPSISPSLTPSSTKTVTPSVTPSLTQSSTRTATPSATPSSTVTSANTATATATPTDSATVTALLSPSFTATLSPSSSMTTTFSATSTPQPTATRTPAMPSLDGPIYQNGGTTIFSGRGAAGDSIFVLKNGSAIGGPGTVAMDGSFVISVPGAGIVAGDSLAAAAGSAGGPQSPVVIAQAAGSTGGTQNSPIDSGASALILTGSPGQPVVIVDASTGEVLGSGSFGPSGGGIFPLDRPLSSGETVQVITGGVLDLIVTASSSPGQPPVLTAKNVLVEGSLLSGHGTAGSSILVVDSQGKVLGSTVVDAQGDFSLMANGASAGVGVDVYQNGVKAGGLGLVARALGNERAFLSANIFRPSKGQPLDIGFKADADDHVTVRIFNMAGELVLPVAEMDTKTGVLYAAAWNGKNIDGRWVASGIYFVSIHGAHTQSIKKVVLFR